MMIRKTLLPLFLLIAFSVVSAQEKLVPSNSFTVTGNVKSAMTVTVSALSAYRQHDLGKVRILNHEGVLRRELTQVKGVLLKDVLAKVQLDAPSPKDYSRYFFTVKAPDGYTIVFSWNELFNNAAGDKIFLVTGIDGIPVVRLDERMAILATSDVNTGRRFIKGITSITVTRVD